MQHQDLTHRIIAAAMKVHSTLGNGFQKVIYQRALEIEFPYHNLAFEREKEMPIHYCGHQIGARRVDFIVEKMIRCISCAPAESASFPNQRRGNDCRI
jgi:GxxExxY protein